MKRAIAACVFLLGMSHPSAAQWVTQDIALRAGWNAVYLEIQPEPSSIDVAFAGSPVQSVWVWNPTSDDPQFIQDVDQLIQDPSDWLVWTRDGAPVDATRRLSAFLGGRPCLIEVEDGSAPFSWSAHGQPIVRTQSWISNSMNFVGFSVDPLNPPLASNFFASSEALSGQLIYTLNPSGRWVSESPGGAQVAHGSAFWMYCDGASTFQGPLNLRTEKPAGLDFGRSLTELEIEIGNPSAQPRQVQLRLLESDDPSPGYLTKAGSVALTYFNANLGGNDHGWRDFDDPLIRVIPPGGSTAFNFSPQRDAFAPVSPTEETGDYRYQSVLEVVDDLGGRVAIPVVAKGLEQVNVPEAPQPLQAGIPRSDIHPRAGLWVGMAVVDKVSEPANVNAPTTPVPTASTFQFRLLVHVDASGQARLLQSVTQMWKEGTTRPDPANPGFSLIDEPGRYVLVTRPEFLDQFSGVSVRDGDGVGRRLSSANFAFRNPLPLNGAGEFGANTISGVAALGFNDPLNPFKHQFHPDHDNLDARFMSVEPEGRESFDITREIELRFVSVDPTGFELPGWGDSQLGGTYHETVQGVHRDPIFVEGAFRLHHASTVAVLNDGIE